MSSKSVSLKATDSLTFIRQNKVVGPKVKRRVVGFSLGRDNSTDFYAPPTFYNAALQIIHWKSFFGADHIFSSATYASTRNTYVQYLDACL